MHWLFVCTIACASFLPPTGLRAGDAAALEIPFDDVDPAVAQAEVARHIDRFVKTLEAQWGHSRESVRDRTAGTLQREDSTALIYTGTLLDHGVVEGYDFREGSLVRGRYVFLQRPVNGLNEFIEYYAAVKDTLTAVYGQPLDDRTMWENDLYEPLPDYWGIAVQMGHLRYTATWKTPQGTMSIELTGNHHSRLAIEYRSNHFAEPLQTA